MSDALDVFDLEQYRSGDPQDNIDAALATVRGYCGWHIAPSRTDTLTIHSATRQGLILPTLYLTDVSSVLVGSTAVDVSAVRWTTSGMVERPGWGSLDGYWSWTDRSVVTITFTHGYDKLPADVRAVALALADGGASSAGGRVKQVGAVAYDFSGPSSSGDVLDAHRGILDRYRLPRLA